jgi:TetR/AcrR family transcriptional regulator
MRKNLGTRRQPEESRRAILDAASREFAALGVAGARIDAIAGEAKVNKALLYYYFRDKEGLYGATLEYNFRGLLDELLRILDGEGSAGQKMLAYALTHFNYVASHPHYRRLVQHEMMRAGTGSSVHFSKLVENFFRPLLRRVVATVTDGIKQGEFRQVQAVHFVHSMVAVIVFYFTAVPVMKEISGIDPLSPPALQVRREAMLDFIGSALFVDRDRAAEITKHLLHASHPQPSGKRLSARVKGRAK